MEEEVVEEMVEEEEEEEEGVIKMETQEMSLNWNLAIRRDFTIIKQQSSISMGNRYVER